MIFRHIPFARGCATIVIPCVPHGRRDGAARYRNEAPVTHVHVFVPADSGNQLACEANFFDPAAVLPWISEQIGAMRLHEIKAAVPADTLQRQLSIAEEMCRLGFMTEQQKIKLRFISQIYA